MESSRLDPATLDWYRGRTVLITGASGGIGADMAHLLAPARPTLLLTARSEDALDRVAEAARREGAEAHVFVQDLSQPGAAHTLFEAVEAAGHRVEVLVNNAGFGKLGPLMRHDAATHEEILTLNVTSLVSLTRLALPGMIAQNYGGVLNVGSLAGYAPVPHFATYSASKTFVKYFTDALHAELRRTGIHVTTLCPGPTETGFFTRAAMKGAPGASVMVDSVTVASAGLRALARDKRVENVSLMNELMALTVRLTPTVLALAVGAWMMRQSDR